MNNNIIASDKPADRIKLARTMAGVTRQFLQDEFALNANTLRAWEDGRNALSEEAARKMVAIFSSLGICCSERWLLKGVGKKPYYLESKSGKSTKKSDRSLVEEEKIFKESILFQSHYSNTRIVVINDSAMLPFYQIGDLVGGFEYEENELNFAIGHNSIITTSEGEVFFRKLLQTEDNSYLLSAINPFTNDAQPLIYRDNLISAAPVIWHRKKHPIQASNLLQFF